MRYAPMARAETAAASALHLERRSIDSTRPLVTSALTNPFISDVLPERR
jgi:hypothetical protein